MYRMNQNNCMEKQTSLFYLIQIEIYNEINHSCILKISVWETFKSEHRLDVHYSDHCVLLWASKRNM